MKKGSVQQSLLNSSQRFCAQQIDVDVMADIDRLDTITGSYMVYKFSPANILSLIDTTQIHELEKRFRVSTTETIDLYTFTWTLIQFVPHDPAQTTYLAVGIIELYKHILKLAKRRDGILWAHFTAYLFDTVFDNEQLTLATQTKLLKKNATFVEATDAPIVYGGRSINLRDIQPSRKYVDKRHHKNGVKKVVLAPKAGYIMALDNMSTFLDVYTYKSAYIGKIVAFDYNHTFDSHIMDYAWSNSEMRIGAIVQDYKISFWDFCDNFTLEKTFSTLDKMRDLQRCIWYLEDSGQWLTTDQSWCLITWDVEEETHSKWPKRHSQMIVCLTEIPTSNRAFTTGLDKHLIMWDALNRAALIDIDQITASIHTIVYSTEFNLLLTAGYEPTATVWRFDSSWDCYIGGRLTGHITLITGMAYIPDTPLIVTSDESGYMRVWDIRNYKWTQTISMQGMLINQIAAIGSLQTFLPIGNRVYWFQYDTSIVANPNGIQNKGIFPMAIMYNPSEYEMVICTNFDVRIIDIYTGKLKKIFADTSRGDQEMLSMTLTNDNRRILVGDMQGQLKWYVYSNSDELDIKKASGQEIISLYYDYTYKLVISVSCQIKFWKEGEFKDPLKVLEFPKDHTLTLFAWCPFLNMFAAVSDSGSVNIFSYSRLTFTGSLSNSRAEIWALRFLEPYYILVTWDTDQKVIGWNVRDKNTMQRPLFLISTEIPVQIVFTTLAQEPKNKGWARTFMTSVKTRKIITTLFIATDLGEIEGWDISNQLTGMIECSGETNHADVMRPTMANSTAKVQYAEQQHKDATENMKIMDQRHKIYSWKAHNDTIKVMEIVKIISLQFLFTAGYDGSVKIWSWSGEQIGSSSLMGREPEFWNLGINTFSIREKLYSRGVRVLKRLRKLYEIKFHAEVESQLKLAKKEQILIKTTDLRDVNNMCATPKRLESTQTSMSTRSRSTKSLKQMESTKKIAQFGAFRFGPDDIPKVDETAIMMQAMESIYQAQKQKRPNPKSRMKYSESMRRLKNGLDAIDAKSALKLQRRAAIFQSGTPHIRFSDGLGETKKRKLVRARSAARDRPKYKAFIAPKIIPKRYKEMKEWTPVDMKLNKADDTDNSGWSRIQHTSAKSPQPTSSKSPNPALRRMTRSRTTQGRSFLN